MKSGMPKFLDVNVWLPLVWNGHVATRTAQAWASGTTEDLVMCRVTELALLRHLTNPAIMGNDVLTNVAAARLVRALQSQDAVLLAADPPGIEIVFPSMGETTRADRNCWTDAYLAAFAIVGHFELVTFDRDFKKYESRGLRWQLLSV